MKNIVKTVTVVIGAMLLAGSASAADGVEIEQRPDGAGLYRAQKVHNLMIRAAKVPGVGFNPVGVEIEFRGDKGGGGSGLDVGAPGNISLLGGTVAADGGWFCAAAQGTPLEQFAEIALRCPGDEPVNGD